MIPGHLLLFDTASLAFRAFYGLPSSMTSPDGRPVNAVRGLADFLATFLRAYPATHAVAAWDVDWRPGWRVAAVPSYKTHRLADPAEADAPPRLTDRSRLRLERIAGAEQTDELAPEDYEAQVPWILELLRLAGIPVVGCDHYEADDVIGTLARTSPMSVDVVTGDRDLFQLVDDARGVRVAYTGSGVRKHTLHTDESIVAAYGVLPAQYADLALLRGDPSDGLPGVAGIGEKTAASLLRKHGDLEGILAAASDPGSGMAPGMRAKLAGAIGYLGAARDVVRVVDDIPNPLGFDGFRIGPVPDADAYRAFAERIGLGGSAERLADALAATPGAV